MNSIGYPYMDTYTIEEVTRKGCFVAHGLVYDPNGLNHPGGLGCIIKSIGKDSSYHYDMHSRAGRKQWDKYCIGKLKGT